MENPPKQDAVVGNSEAEQETIAANQVPETGESLIRKSEDILRRMNSLKLEEKDSSIKAAVLEASHVDGDGLMKLDGNAVEKKDMKENTRGSPTAIKPNDEEPLPTNEEKPDQAIVEEGGAEDAKKKKKKSKAKNSKPKPSGFEQYFVDVPVTPAEYLEEENLYAPTKSITERLQIAIQRYIARRKFDPLRKQVFDKYMAYGRVKSGPNPFTGGHDEKDPSLTAEDIARLKARHFFVDDAEETSEVDFDGVAKGFLSAYLPQVVDLYRQEDIITAVGVVRNFLNYLLHHDVVPDYKSQVEAAKRTCDLAEGQLWLCCQASTRLPGTFNEACSLLWGGFYRDTYPEDMEAAKEMEVLPKVLLADAKKIFIAGLAAHGSQEKMKTYNDQMSQKSFYVKRKFETFIEVDKIIMPNQYVRAMYEHPVSGGFPRTGKIETKTWYNPGAAPEDLTDEEEAEIEKNGRPIEHYDFIVEEGLLLNMFPGIKIQATIYETSFGVFYFDQITAVVCSFYTYLLNEDLVDYKPHVFLPQRETMEPENAPVEATIVGPEVMPEPESVTTWYKKVDTGSAEGDGDDAAGPAWS